MTALTGPALLRAAADRLDQMNQDVTGGPWWGMHWPHGCEVQARPGDDLAVVVVAGDMRQEDASFAVTMRGLVPDLAAWLRDTALDIDDGCDSRMHEHAEDLARKVLGQ